MRITIMTAALLALAATGCGRGGDQGDTYAGSRQVPVAVSVYTPEGDPVRSMTMVGRVPMETTTPGRPPTVGVAFKGSGAYTYRLPRDCPAGAVQARQGRMVRMRVDRWRRADGTIVERLSSDEVVDALCRGEGGRDVPMEKTVPRTAS